MPTKYRDCQRCGRPMLGAGRVLQTGRLVCFKCYEQMTFGPDNRMVDDGVTRTWEETKRLQQKKIEQATGYRSRAAHKIRPMEMEE